MKTPHRNRIQVAVSLLGEFTKFVEEIDRVKAVEILKKTYQEKKLQPIRGKAEPPDLYDKEMATLYVIGKYGLKLDHDYPELFEKVFYLESNLEEVVNKILESRYQEAREKLRNLSPSGVIDSNMIARLLRIPLTKLFLGFISEEDFKNILHKVQEAFPEEEKSVSNYARFFVALKLSEAIQKGEIKTREEKEALKKALAIRIGFPRSTPSDDYVRAVAKSVFNVSDKLLNRILGTRKNSTEGSAGT
ncbi:MAG: DUF2192 domain-containing protein [Desulfurococcaceae archaeon]